MLRNFVLGAAFAAAAGNASAATMTVYETPAGSELVSSLDAGAATYQVVYSLNICPLTSGDILVVTSESQIQNSSLTDDIYIAAQLRRDTTASTAGSALASEGNGTNIAPHDYRLVSPKVSISTITSNTGECVINYIARAAGEPGDTVDVVNSRGRLQVLKITP
jgi:NMD protein affecting ribosome stability and mRNA decay